MFSVAECNRKFMYGSKLVALKGVGRIQFSDLKQHLVRYCYDCSRFNHVGVVETRTLGD